MNTFRKLLTPGDHKIAWGFVGAENANTLRDPDVVIAPEGAPYIYRWHIVPRNAEANVYFHIQTISDPDRPLHDHPWDNTSVILAGGYDEVLRISPNKTTTLRRVPGQVVFRPAEMAHRLILPEGVPYSMSLFTTGKHRRDWGFHTKQGWISHTKAIADIGGKSVYTGPEQ